MMLEVGRVCLKTAGKDAGKRVVIVDQLDGKFVLIDGQVKRKRCNIAHLEPLNMVWPIKKNATHEEVVQEFAKIGIIISEKHSRQPQQPPAKKRAIKASEEKQQAHKEKMQPSEKLAKK